MKAMPSAQQRNRRDSYHPEKARHNRMGKVSSAFIICERENWTLSKNCGKLFWLVIILIGACLTVKMCIDVYNEYKEKRTTISVNYIYNDSLTFPIAPTLCLYIYNLHMNDLWYLQIYDEPDLTWEQSNAYFDANMTKKKLIGKMKSNTHWPISMIKTVDIIIQKSTYTSSSKDFLDWKLGPLNVTYAELEPRLQQELDFIKRNEKFTVYEKAINKFFASPNLTRDSFLYRNSVSTWLPSWTLLSHICLNYAAMMEFGSDYSYAMSYYVIYFENEGNQIQNACLLIESHLQRFDLTMDDLRQRFGWEMAKLHSLRFAFNNGSAKTMEPGHPKYEDIPADQWISIARTVHVSGNEVCYRLNVTKQYEAKEVEMYTIIKANKPGRDRYPPPYATREGRFAIAVDISGKERDVIEFNDQYHSDDKLYPDAVRRTLKILQSKVGNTSVKIFENTFRTVDIRLSAEYHYLPEVHDQIRCVAGKTVHEYMRDCKLNIIEKELNCTPTSMIPLNEGRYNVECSLATLGQPTFFKVDDLGYTVGGSQLREVVSCVDACMHACEDWHIEFLEVDTNMDAYMGQWYDLIDVTYLAFKFTFDKYDVYEETLLITSSTLYSNLGGVLGLFLGIDLIVTVQFIIGPFLYFYASCVRLCGNSQTTAEPHLEGNAVSPYETNIHEEIRQIKEQLLKMREQNATTAEIHQKEIQVNRNLIEQMKSKHMKSHRDKN